MVDKFVRRGRELFSWGPEVCLCEHSPQVHLKKNCYGLVGNNFDNQCPCQEYRPKDNLVFLEHKFKEKLKREQRTKN